MDNERQHDEQMQEQGTLQLGAGEELVFPDLKLGGAWGESITERRAHELDALRRQWELEKKNGERRATFDGVPLTGADVLYLAAHSLASPDGDLAMAAVKLLDPFVYRNEFVPKLDLKYADLSYARLEHAVLRQAHLEGAILVGAHLEGAILWQAHLAGANLAGAFLDAATVLRKATVTDEDHGSIRVYDVRWQGVILGVVDWTVTRRRFFRIFKRSEFMNLRDDERAWRPTLWGRLRHGVAAFLACFGLHLRPQGASLNAFREAARANSQLAAAMRAQGMHDEADHFAYRGQVCQRGLHLLRRGIPSWLFWWFLFILAGYGYRPLRTVFWYAVVIFGFAFLYMHLGTMSTHPFEFKEALVFSVTSFHGRGFFPGMLSLKDVVTGLAATEAVVGLVIEVSLIATFTQRFFAR